MNTGAADTVAGGHVAAHVAAGHAVPGAHAAAHIAAVHAVARADAAGHVAAVHTVVCVRVAADAAAVHTVACGDAAADVAAAHTFVCAHVAGDRTVSAHHGKVAFDIVHAAGEVQLHPVALAVVAVEADRPVARHEQRVPAEEHRVERIVIRPGQTADRALRRGIGVGSLTAKQLVEGEAQRVGQRGQKLHVGTALIRLPFGDRLVGHAQGVCQRLLGHFFFAAALCDARAEANHFHRSFLHTLSRANRYRSSPGMEDNRHVSLLPRQRRAKRHLFRHDSSCRSLLAVSCSCTLSVRLAAAVFQ